MKILDRIIKFLICLMFIPFIWIILFIGAIIVLMLPFYALIFPEYINLSKKGSIEVK
jgi:hypothetical protein